jgi:hypothetical protein
MRPLHDRPEFWPFSFIAGVESCWGLRILDVAGPEEPPKPASGTCHVIEIADVVARAGADVDEAHLQHVIRAVRSA